MTKFLSNLCFAALVATAATEPARAMAGDPRPAPADTHRGSPALVSNGHEHVIGAKQLAAAMEREGLRPARYGLNASEEGDDALLEAFVKFALDVRDGAVNPRIDYTDDAVSVRTIDGGSLLSRLKNGESASEILTSLYNANPQQQRLRRALDRYRDYVASRSWSEIVLTSDVVEKGDVGRDVESISQRLAAEGFWTEDLSTNDRGRPIYDLGLEEAVKAFQRSRGLTDDGVVGPETLAKMNVSAAALVDTLKVNLERARWLPQEFPERFVLVNIASFRLEMFDAERRVDDMAVIVGTEQNKTPVFAAALDYLVINPYWNIPESIVSNELAPKQVGDPNYLESKNMEVLSGWDDEATSIDPKSIDWNALPSPLSFRVRQKPGPANALGQIKFMFPNEYSVYLHDTPADSLFERQDRTFSHGCIRVERPFELAQWVLGDRAADVSFSNLSNIEPATRIDVAEDLGVFIVYATASVDDNGTVYFYDDIYERDGSLLGALEGSA